MDPDGLWSISVTASPNREQNPYALFQVYNNQNQIVYQTIVKVKGLYRDRKRENGDTPTGVYKIIGWRKTGNNRYPAISYGFNDLLALEYIEGEAKQSGRQGMHVHGGRSQQELSITHGCIRIADSDIAELKEITTLLELIDEEEHGTILTVRNTLTELLQYSDKAEVKWSFLLPEVTVYPKKMQSNQ